MSLIQKAKELKGLAKTFRQDMNKCLGRAKGNIDKYSVKFQFIEAYHGYCGDSNVSRKDKAYKGAKYLNKAIEEFTPKIVDRAIQMCESEAMLALANAKGEAEQVLKDIKELDLDSE